MISRASTGKVVEKKVEDIMQEMTSLKQQLKSVLPVYNQQGASKSEFSRGNTNFNNTGSYFFSYVTALMFNLKPGTR
jgi:hypothetical protein